MVHRLKVGMALGLLVAGVVAVPPADAGGPTRGGADVFEVLEAARGAALGVPVASPLLDPDDPAPLLEDGRTAVVTFETAPPEPTEDAPGDQQPRFGSAVDKDPGVDLATVSVFELDVDSGLVETVTDALWSQATEPQAGRPVVGVPDGVAAGAVPFPDRAVVIAWRTAGPFPSAADGGGLSVTANDPALPPFEGADPLNEGTNTSFDLFPAGDRYATAEYVHLGDGEPGTDASGFMQRESGTFAVLYRDGGLLVVPADRIAFLDGGRGQGVDIGALFVFARLGNTFDLLRVVPSAALALIFGPAQLTPPPPPPPDPAPPADPGAAPPADPPQESASGSSDGGSGLFVWLVLVALVVIVVAGLFWRQVIAPKRADPCLPITAKIREIDEYLQEHIYNRWLREREHGGQEQAMEYCVRQAAANLELRAQLAAELAANDCPPAPPPPQPPAGFPSAAPAPAPSPAPAGGEPSGPTQPGVTTGGGAGGTSTPPPTPPVPPETSEPKPGGAAPPPPPQDGDPCDEATAEPSSEFREATFTIPGGDLVITASARARGAVADWAAGAGVAITDDGDVLTVPAAAAGAIPPATMRAVTGTIRSGGAPAITFTVPLTQVSVSCTETLVCEEGVWVMHHEFERSERSVPAWTETYNAASSREAHAGGALGRAQQRAASAVADDAALAAQFGGCG